jgi:glycosyltransferase involved in cell wall biosynthesis
MYAGNLGDLQGLDALLDVFAATPDASLVLLGEGVARQRLQRRVDELRVANIRVLPAVPLSAVGRFLAAADIQVVSLQDTPLLRVTMPSKVQTSLATGKPVFVHAAGDAADLVVNAGCGWAATPGDLNQGIAVVEAGLAASDAELAATGERSRRLFDADYSLAAGPRRLADAIENACQA